MSELSKKNNVVIFVVIYFILAMIYTAFSILFYKTNGVSFIEYFFKKEDIDSQEIVVDVIENKSTTSKENEKIKRISLTDMYKKNNLKIEEIYYEYGDEYIDEYNSRKKVIMSYIQISGLKNKEIEEKINKEIEEKSKGLVTSQEINNNQISYINVYAYCWNRSSFSNLLSITLVKDVEYKNYEKETQYYTDSLNYRLDTGEEIAFEELFTPDASLKNIVAQSAYFLICKNLKNEFDDEKYMAIEKGEISYDELDSLVVDYSEVENITSKIMNEFNSSEEKKFNFTYNKIILMTSYGDVEILMPNFYEYINLFNIVTSDESLYENGDTEESAYVFGLDYSKGFEYKGEISNYIYLTLYNYYLKYEQDIEYEDADVHKQMQLTSKIYQEELEKIKECIVKYERGKNKAYFYNIEDYYDDENDNLVFIGQKVEVEKKNFKDNVEKVYAEASRKSFEPDSIFSLGGIENSESFILVEKDGEYIIEEDQN